MTLQSLDDIDALNIILLNELDLLLPSVLVLYDDMNSNSIQPAS